MSFFLFDDVIKSVARELVRHVFNFDFSSSLFYLKHLVLLPQVLKMNEVMFMPLS
ncbi:hypothetical protein BTN49_1555 [Candidatus Enterovibrio escicola]|uniref:Uncharacterized protein n=1 Tax=Candidatus Enterovibrio escicola TaxID=1927127 RepID=A0A2A5T4B8_9GAMM|nr:hypothetical protein BTN49_1555 [Candidatus Enterovibrio escacola]